MLDLKSYPEQKPIPLPVLHDAAEGQKDRQTERETVRQTEKETVRQTDGQTVRCVDICSCWIETQRWADQEEKSGGWSRESESERERVRPEHTL